MYLLVDTFGALVEMKAIKTGCDIDEKSKFKKKIQTFLTVIHHG